MTKPSYEVLETNAATQQHINLVRIYLRRIAVELLKRGEVHDLSKFSDSEAEVFAEYTPKLKASSYGSEEYNGFLREMGMALSHHYGANRHHPEFQRQDEQWRDVVGFEGRYEVSNHGSVRSVSREVDRSGPTGSLTKKGKVLRQCLTPKGYRRLQLQSDGKVRNAFVHVLVAEAFIPNPTARPQVNHKNGEPSDNHVLNLEWVTSSENLQHAYDTWLRKPTAEYVVTCVELGVSTIGCTAMEDKLQSMGYPKVRASGIWRVINHGGTHLDLTFTGSKFEQSSNSPLHQMNLVDILEMFLDWTASSKRHADGDIMKSIEINRDRFDMSEQLARIFQNTVKDFFPEELKYDSCDVTRPDWIGETRPAPEMVPGLDTWNCQECGQFQPPQDPDNGLSCISCKSEQLFDMNETSWPCHECKSSSVTYLDMRNKVMCEACWEDLEEDFHQGL